jgi:hypothetical protein
MERARQMDGIRNPSIKADQIVQHVIAIQMLQKRFMPVKSSGRQI